MSTVLRNQPRPAYSAEDLQAHVRSIVDTWPPLTAEQKTTIYHAIAPMRAAITKRKRASPTEGGTGAAA